MIEVIRVTVNKQTHLGSSAGEWLIHTCLLTVFYGFLSLDSHSASEVVVWGGGGGEAGERNQEPAEDVPHYVNSSSTTHLHVLAHLPPHQIKPGTNTLTQLCGRWTWLSKCHLTPKTLARILRKTDLDEHTLATDVWVISHHSQTSYAWSRTTHATRQEGMWGSVSLIAQPHAICNAFFLSFCMPSKHVASGFKLFFYCVIIHWSMFFRNI